MPVRAPDRFLVFGAPQIQEAEIDEVVATMRSGWLGTGPRVRRFEQALAEYKGVAPEQVVAVNSCTAALHLSLALLDLRPGDEVITTPMTFCATVHAIIHAGGTPVLADVDADTLNLDPESVRAQVTDRTRAILPVHFAGRGADLEPLQALCDERGIALVEDCAHAVETLVGGRHAGAIGDFGCFSFYATKNVATGEGGALIARDAELAARARRLALHGMSADAHARFGASGYKHYAVVEAGFKYNMMDLQAAIGIHQLERVEGNHLRRRAVWDRYLEAFGDLPVTLPASLPGEDERHALHLFTVLVHEERAGVSRDDALQKMKAEGIGVGVHYLAIPEHPYYRERFGWQIEDTPRAVRIGRQTMSLPLSPALTDDDVEDVITAFRQVVGAG